MLVDRDLVASPFVLLIPLPLVSVTVHLISLGKRYEQSAIKCTVTEIQAS